MAPPRLAVIDADVQALMGVEDERVWQAEGLFISVDSLVLVQPHLIIFQMF
jgi:hypothetical protein